MKTHTVFTLIDGEKFDDIKKALNHCDENMVIHQSENWKIEQDTLGNFTVTKNATGESVYLQTQDDKEIFREELKNYNRFDALCENYEVAMS